MRTVTVGLDLGDRYSRFCAIDSEGSIVQEGRVASTTAALSELFAGACQRIILEVGTHSPWTSRLLQQLGHDVVVADPRKLPLIFGATNKSDRLDAENLARVGRMDVKLLNPVQHRGPQAQADLAVLRSRDALVHTRTQLVNHVRGAVKAVGGRVLKCSTPAFGRKAAGQIPAALKPALRPVLALLEELTGQIRAYDRRIEQMSRTRYPETERLRQVTGVGALTALAYVLTLEDPARFSTSRAVGPYLGLRPRLRESGDSSPQLGISKAGDVMLRRLLVGSAHYILGPFGPDCELRRWGLELAARGGSNAKKRAAVAVARKLAVLLHRLWMSGEPYDPFYRQHRDRSCATASG